MAESTVKNFNLKIHFLFSTVDSNFDQNDAKYLGKVIAWLLLERRRFEGGVVSKLKVKLRVESGETGCCSGEGFLL